MGFGPQSGFINAVLRSYIRERDQSVELLNELKATNLAIGYSHPEWLVERWQSRWGKDDTRKLLEWNNTPPVTFARVNTLRTTAGELVATWSEEGVTATPRRFDWVGDGIVYELESHPALTSLVTFQGGRFYIQDPSTLLSVMSLNPQPGEQVLDLCAAPGGKTTFMAQLMNDSGLIVARDPHPDRRDLVRENCARLGVTCVKIETLDQAQPADDMMFDRVLVDAPCSNTGVLRRRVDARWRITPEGLSRLAQTQCDLLHSAASQLKPGGTLVYSTCSIESDENEDVVRTFAESSGFRVDFERTLLPFRDAVDGAYVARLIRC
jgi:16S rRNA (cytosine967-C5)-methyltransferase